MPIKVLIVDDSVFFQSRLREIISEHEDLEVIGIASNGQEAVDKVKSLKPDIVTMDFEMPVMDGITAISIIMAENPTPIIMFSSLTYEGARITLDALAAGALDYLPKDFAEVTRNSTGLKERLHERLLTLARKNVAKSAKTPNLPSPTIAVKKIPPIPLQAVSRSLGEKPAVRPKLILIGASTGGPIALTDILSALPENFPIPILLVQHMPENFTKAFSERLNRLSKIEVREAVDGDLLKPGLALLAPGGKQMMLNKRGTNSIKIIPDDGRLTYRPCLDVTFGSAANIYADSTLALILTGMGSDGCRGAEILIQKGSRVWSQDEASCVVYGMPMAVVEANLSQRVVKLSEIAQALVTEVG